MNWAPTERTVEAFTCGDCWALAIELYRLTGYPVIFASPLDDNGTDLSQFYWEHVALVIPSGEILDVHGVSDPDVWRKKWSAKETVATSDPEEIAELTSDLDGRQYPDVNPRALARRLLNHFRIPTTGRRHRDALPTT